MLRGNFQPRSLNQSLRILLITGLAVAGWSLASWYQQIISMLPPVLSLFREDLDFQVYFSNLGWIRHGVALYDHGYAEYPVLGLMYVNWPHYVTQSFESFHWLLWFSNAGLLLLSVWLWREIAELIGLSKGGWWLWLLPSSLYYSLNRFDIFPVCLVLISLYLLLHKYVRSAWVVYGLAIMAKTYPLFLLPLYLQLSREQKTSWHVFLPYLLAPILGLLFGAWSVGGWAAVVVPYTLQLARGVGLGSLRALAEQFGAAGSLWPAVAQLGQIIVPAWWFCRAVANKSPLTTRGLLALAAITLLLLTNLYPFYSNQWWLWVLPFVVWVLPPPYRWQVAAYDLVNYVQFPIAFQLWGQSSSLFSFVVAIRGALVLWLVVLLWQQLPRRWWSLV